MSAPTLAEFDTPEALVDAVKGLPRGGFRVVNAPTPFPLPELSALLGCRTRGLRPVRAAGGFGTAAFAYWFQWYTAVRAFAFDAGGRPSRSTRRSRPFPSRRSSRTRPRTTWGSAAVSAG